ncbi:MAG: cation:proton antiporter [Methanolinea sp.]|nr:cation:proton antiporter [Methanolinea sp.]
MDPLISVLLVLAVAKVLGELVERAGYPSLVGEIGGGILLGPAVLGLVSVDAVTGTFADIGLILLLFASGLQLNQRALQRSLKTGIYAAVAGIAIPLLSGIAVGVAWGFDLAASLVTGITLSITSIGVSLRTLVDLRKLKTDIGLVIVNAAVIDDVLGIVLLGSLPALVSGGGKTGDALLGALSAALFLAILLFPGKRLILWVFSVSHRAHTNEMPYSVALIAGLACAVLADRVGLHYAIGAFLSGLILGDSVRNDRTLYDSLSDIAFGLFVTFFFASIGLLFPVDLPGFSVTLLLCLVAVALASKTLGGFAGSVLTLRDHGRALVVGLGLCPRGELALVVVKTALAAGLISATLFSTLALVVIVTVLLSPFLMTYGYSLAAHSGARPGKRGA